MGLNPYNYQRYLEIGTSHSAPLLPPRTGMSHSQIDEYGRMQQQIEETNRRRYYEDSQGFLHGNWRDTVHANAGNELSLGRQPCQRVRDNW